MARVYLSTKNPTQLPGAYDVTRKSPFDARDIVETFLDLIDYSTFGKNVYEGMRVMVLDEGNVYELISQSEENRLQAISGQFVKKEDETTDLSPNKKLWKRLTIETINANNDNDAARALTRAKNNLVNGALIYIANDITLDDGTIQKSGLYFCQNVDGEGRLTMAGGGVTTEEFNELNNKVDVDKVSTAIEAAIAALVDGAPEDLNTLKELSAALKDNPSVIEALNTAIGKKADQSSLNALSAEVSRIDEVAGAASASIDDLEESLGDYADKTKIDEAINQAIEDAIYGVLETAL